MVSLTQTELEIPRIGVLPEQIFSGSAIGQLTGALKKAIVTMSTCEAEYVSPSFACNEAV